MAQMMFYSGVLKQDDKKFLINPFEKLVGEPICLEKEDYVKLTAEAYDQVVNVLDLKHREPIFVVYVDSTIDADGLVDVSDLKFVEEKMEYTEESKLDMYKEKVLRQMNEIIANQNMISNFELYRFFKLNQELNAKGFFITNANREEKYLEVIESGDEETLRILSEYLDALDEYSAIDDTYEKATEYKNKVKAANDFKQIEELFYEFAGKLL